MGNLQWSGSLSMFPLQAMNNTVYHVNVRVPAERKCDSCPDVPLATVHLQLN